MNVPAFLKRIIGENASCAKEAAGFGGLRRLRGGAGGARGDWGQGVWAGGVWAGGVASGAATREAAGQGRGASSTARVPRSGRVPWVTVRSMGQGTAPWGTGPLHGARDRHKVNWSWEGVGYLELPVVARG